MVLTRREPSPVAALLIVLSAKPAFLASSDTLIRVSSMISDRRLNGTNSSREHSSGILMSIRHKTSIPSMSQNANFLSKLQLNGPIYGLLQAYIVDARCCSCVPLGAGNPSIQQVDLSSVESYLFVFSPMMMSRSGDVCRLCSFRTGLVGWAIALDRREGRGAPGSTFRARSSSVVVRVNETDARTRLIAFKISISLVIRSLFVVMWTGKRKRSMTSRAWAVSPYSFSAGVYAWRHANPLPDRRQVIMPCGWNDTAVEGNMNVSRENIINAIGDGLRDDGLVYAMWLEGSDAHGLQDEYSDIDIWLDVEDGKAEDVLDSIRAATHIRRSGKRSFTSGARRSSWCLMSVSKTTAGRSPS